MEMQQQFKVRFVFYLALALIILLLSLSARPASGQQSLRTQQSLRPRSDAITRARRSTSTVAESNVPGVPRFLGWRRAAQDGPETVKYFRALMAKSRANLGTAPISTSVTANAGVKSQSGSPQTTFPGILLRPSMPAGAFPAGVVTGDFNGDHKLDWAVANAGDNTIDIYLGNGDGTSQLPLIIPLNGVSPVGIAVGDLNGDGKLDLAVVEADSNTIGILFGNGDGTFQSEVELPVQNVQAQGIAIADVNKDGHQDILIAINGGFGAQLNLDFEVWLNDGTGRFGAPIYGPPLISDGADEGFSIAVGDLNGDGIPDLMVSGADAFSTTLKSYFGKGDGTFTAGTLVWSGNPGTGSDVTTAALADVNGDGCPDLAVAIDLGWVDLFYNDCQGNFPTAPSHSYGTGDGAVSVVLADVNGDGFADIVAGGFPVPDTAPEGDVAGDTVTVRLNDGTGNFGAARTYRGDPGMFAVAVADLKGDGKPDIVTANQNANSTTVFANDGAGGFGEPMGGYDGYLEGAPNSPTNAPATGDVVADVDGDGKPDLALLERATVSTDNMIALSVLLNQGNGQFSLPIRTPVIDGNSDPEDFVLADFRGIGKPDFASLVIDQTGQGAGAQIIYAENMGSGQFGPPTAIALPSSNPYAFGTIAVGDFNGDGKLDLAVAAPNVTVTPSVDVLTVYLGNGDGTFKASPYQLTFGDGENVNAIFVGDANGDGKKDIFVWMSSQAEIGQSLNEFLGNGDGTFQAPKQVLPSLAQMTMVDLNHDGILDVVDVESEGSNGIPGETPPTISVFLGQSNGGFAQPVTYTPYSGNVAWYNGLGLDDGVFGVFAPFLGDFDGDGNQDLAILQQNQVLGQGAYVQFMKGNGDGTFTPTFDVFPFGISQTPELAAFNLLGDNRSSFVQTPSFTSAYQVIPAAPAPGVQIEMEAIPVVGFSDAVEVSINVPSPSSTNVTLSASDPNVQIPASVTIPAGQISAPVIFATSNLPANHWFSITAQANGGTATAYNFALLPGSASPFALSVFGGFAPHTIGNFSSPAPGQISNWGVNISSTGLGSGIFEVACNGLPQTASCNGFSPVDIQVEAGLTNGNTFNVTTSSSIAPGEYPFTVSASDSSDVFMAPAMLEVGDFTIGLSPSSLSAPPSGQANYVVTVTSLFGYQQGETLSCSNLPAGASCALQGQSALGGAQPFTLNLSSIPQGNYTFTVTGTSNSLVHSATAQLQVGAQAIASVPRSPISFGPILVNGTGTAPSLSVMNTGNIPLSFTSIAAVASSGSAGTFAQTNGCGTSLGPGLSCTINVTFSSTAVGSSTGTLTLTDNAADSPQVLSLSGTAGDFSFQAANGSPTTQTISPGQNAIYGLSVQPNQLPATIALSCSGAPPEATCNIPSSVTLQGVNVPITVTVNSTAASGLPAGPVLMPNPRWLLSSLCVAAMTAFLLLLARRRTVFVARAVFVVVLVGLLGIVSCGGGSSGDGGGGGGGGGIGGTPAGTYTLTVTGSYAGAKRTIDLTLVVN
jgi:FG-GAP-like repeat